MLHTSITDPIHRPDDHHVPPLTRYGLLAEVALLRETVVEAVRAVGLLVPGHKLLPGKEFVAPLTHEALPVVGALLVRNSALADHLGRSWMTGSRVKGQ